jgi:hypothetical protein
MKMHPCTILQNIKDCHVLKGQGRAEPRMHISDLEAAVCGVAARIQQPLGTMIPSIVAIYLDGLEISYNRQNSWKRW